MAVFFLDWLNDKTGWNVPSMMATFYLFVICAGILVIVSLNKPHVHTEKSIKPVWTSPLEALRGRLVARALDYRIAAAVLFVVMVILYIVFA